MLNRIDQLEKREKIYLLVGIVVILATILFYGIYQPYHERLMLLDKKIASKQSQLLEVKDLQVEYQALQKQLEYTQKSMSSSGSMSPLAKMEELASNVVGRENLSYIRPQPSQVQGEIRIDNLDIKLEKLSLEQMLQLLWKIEAPESQMQIKTFRSKKRFDNASEVDLTMTISVYGKN
ncbi:general secretion pathway protein M [Desulfuromusa kysingii]|uniref:General secretion pathway protein M n=1 Tax=Desulfuromusa kysingii TaxID=37625 RepID=A0A1H4CRX6_9BACT|nr:type II secretion system protein GspM [Desulfuromusa kysingii]SEA63094.1 general secretion pathway protein M [Desulfuromusa kysingii]